jgi:CxxC motif-containing protein (DUF1111 family)
MTRVAHTPAGWLCLKPAFWPVLLLALCSHQVAAAVAADAAFSAAERKAFMQPAADLPFEQRMTFVLGRAIFEKIWVSSPSSTTASDGLGPLYNARSCLQCHINNGRGLPPDEQGSANRNGILIQLGIPGNGHTGRQGVTPDPVYGRQLQTFAVTGLPAEARLKLTYSYESVPLNGGETVELRKPVYQPDNPGYGDFHPQLQLSPRLAPAMIGLGLLELIPEADILAREDPDDLNADGISGRANRVYHPLWLEGRASRSAAAEHQRTEYRHRHWQPGLPGCRRRLHCGPTDLPERPPWQHAGTGQPGSLGGDDGGAAVLYSTP